MVGCGILCRFWYCYQSWSNSMIWPSCVGSKFSKIAVTLGLTSCLGFGKSRRCVPGWRAGDMSHEWSLSFLSIKSKSNEIRAFGTKMEHLYNNYVQITETVKIDILNEPRANTFENGGQIKISRWFWIWNQMRSRSHSLESSFWPFLPFGSKIESYLTIYIKIYTYS